MVSPSASQRMDLDAAQIIQTWIYLLPSPGVEPWASHSILFCLRFPICNMEITILTLQQCCEGEEVNTWETASQMVVIQ